MHFRLTKHVKASGCGRATDPSAEEMLGTDWMVNGTDYKSEIKFYKAQQCVLNTGNAVGNGDKVGKSVECS